MFRSLCFAGALVIVGCTPMSSVPTNRPCGADGRLIGKWRTDVRLTQLGRGYHEVEYRCDCTFKLRMTFLDSHIDMGEPIGRFKTTGDQLIWHVDNRTGTDRFWFEGNQLVEREGPETGTDTFRYKKVGEISCD